MAPVRLRDNTGATWAGTRTRLWRGLGDTWVELETGGTHLAFGQSVGSVLVGRTGGSWFSLGGDTDYARVVHDQSPVPLPAIAWAAEPAAATVTDTITARACGGGPPAAILWAWCLDAGEWQVSEPAAGSSDYMLTRKDLQNGPHVCRSRGRDGLRRATAELVHRLEVRRDLDREASAAVARPQSVSFTEREDAARILRGDWRGGPAGVAPQPGSRRA